MRRCSKHSDWIVNLLMAVAISLVVNFSYLILLLVEPGERRQRQLPDPQSEMREEVGVLRLSPDGHGYLVYEAGDSLYVPQHRIWRWELAEGDSLVVTVVQAEREGAHAHMDRIWQRNGESFDLGAIGSRPSRSYELLLQLLFYWVASFAMLSILSPAGRHYSIRGFVMRSLGAIAVMSALYFVAPISEWRTGQIRPNFMAQHHLDYMLLLRSSFAVVVAILFTRIYALIRQRQDIVIENEQLKNENLSTRYNMLMGQINPHFFFNSLNSLAMLVRERDMEKALHYIDQLSYTFRYIIQSGQNTLVTLDEELKFAEAYSYLFKIRYADKLFFDIEVDQRLKEWRLPALSLQPLIGNAVKHNVITKSKPLRVEIRTNGEWLEVSNLKMPMPDPEESTGIGLENLSNRWRLITDHEIEIVDDGERFTVRLPLQRPQTTA